MPEPFSQKNVAASGKWIRDRGRPPSSEQIPRMYVLELPKTKRARYLRAMTSFVEGTQHDHHQTRWDGIPRDPGVSYLWERMNPQGFVPTNAVPYGDRKPDTAYPIGRQVTMRFTELLMGEGRHPALGVPADKDTEDFLEVVMEDSDSWDALIEARDGAGSCGSSALSFGLLDGEPVSESHHTADLWVQRWVAGSRWKPAEVTEQRLVAVERQDPKTGEIEAVRMWRTRYWDEEYAYEYEDVPEDWGKEEEGKGTPGSEKAELKPIPLAKDEAGEPRIYEHHAGRCPVVWLQNTRNKNSPEGRPDNQGALHLGDRMDRLQSMIVRASIANVDPTLVYLDERLMHRGNPLLRKGWGSVIRGSEKATVSLLEVSGASIEMGWSSLHNLRDEYLQTVGCVIVDPQNAGSYKSGEALQILWRSMEAKANRLRVPLRDVLKQISEIWRSIGKAVEIVSLEDKKAQEYQDGEVEGKGQKPLMLLPPKLVDKDPGAEKTSSAGEAEGEDKVSMAHKVGTGVHVEVTWPPYHIPTAAQWQQFVTALVAATGQKPILAQETAVALLVAFAGKGDPTDEFQKLQKQAEETAAQFGASMFGDPEADKTNAQAKGEDAEAKADAEGKKAGKKPQAPASDGKDGDKED